MPFIEVKLIERVFSAAAGNGGCITTFLQSNLTE
jgi:hypothetical protein